MNPAKAKRLVPGIEKRKGWIEFVKTVTKEAALDAAYCLKEYGNPC